MIADERRVEGILAEYLVADKAAPLAIPSDGAFCYSLSSDVAADPLEAVSG